MTVSRHTDLAVRYCSIIKLAPSLDSLSHNIQKIFSKYGNKVKSSKQLTDIIEHTFFCM